MINPADGSCYSSSSPARDTLGLEGSFSGHRKKTTTRHMARDRGLYVGQAFQSDSGLMKTGRNTHILGLRVLAESVALSDRSPRTNGMRMAGKQE